jgi:CysZ protein
VITSAFSRAFRQLPDPKFRSVLLRGLAMTIGVFVVLYFPADYGITYLEAAAETAANDSLGWFLGSIVGFLAWIAGWGTFIIVLYVLFPAIASFFIALFLDDIAEAVEKRYYPTDPPGQSADLLPSLAVAFRFTLVLIGLNLLLLVFLLLGPIYPLVYYVVNGYLLSREYFELVSLRHNDPKTIRTVRRTGGMRLLLAGVIIAFLMTIPLVNLITPLVATAVMVHMFKTLAVRRTI